MARARTGRYPPRVREESGTFQELRPLGEPAAAVSEAARPAGAPLELVPRTSGQILDVALDLARTRFGLYVLAASAVWLFARALQPFIGVAHLEDRLAGSDPFFQLALLMLNAVVQLVIDRLALVAIIVFAWPSVTGTPFSFRASVARAFACLVPVIAMQFVISLALAPALICTCGVGAVYLYWKLSLAPLVYTLERAGFGASIGRSFQLTSQNGGGWEAFAGFLRWFAVIGSAALVALVFQSPASFVDQPQLRVWVTDVVTAPEWAFDAVMVFVTAVFNGIASVVMGLALLAYYLDCRVRRDGLDLRVRLAALASDAPRAPDAAHG